jgi:hypothetical protein
MASNALTTTRELLPPAADWRTMKEMADDLVKSGMLPAHIKTPQAAIAVMLKGRELNVPPMQALGNIAFIQGKTVVMAELMNALVIRDHGAGAMRIVHTDNEGCTIRYVRPGYDVPAEYSFTIADAQRAGLSGDNWRKYPAAMLRARCISAVAKMAFPDTVSGMYTPDELGADVSVSEDGMTIISSDVDDTAAPLKARAEPPVIKEPGITTTQISTIWMHAEKCFGDESEEKVYAHVAKHYPHATQDDKPSLRALTRAEASEMIGRLTQIASKVAQPQELATV